MSSAQPVRWAGAMTAPRQVLPGASYLITRRCAQRQFLLKPSPVVIAVFKFVLAVAAARYGILLHAVCVLSNHFHIVLTDPKAQLPRFEQFLDSLVARALNAFYGRFEHFWGPGSYSAVRLETPEDLLDKVVYTLANPVAAGLVPRGKQWPGVWSDPSQIGKGSEVVERPESFFKPDGSTPDSERLVFVAPAGFESAEAFRRALQAALEERERSVRAERKAKGLGFLGARKVLAQRHTDVPRTEAPRGGLNPRVAARDKWRRIEALRRLVSFLEDYREALGKLRSGIRDVVFPAGTYQLRVSLGVACAGAG